jgi:hypothetical protein
MNFLILIAILLVNITYAFNKVVYTTNTRLMNNLNDDLLPDYEIPKWVYKKVFKHNKIPNRQKYIKKDNLDKSNKFNTNKKFTTMSEEADIFKAVQLTNLPMGLLQPIIKDM